METFSTLLREHAASAAAGRAHARRTVLVAGARAPKTHELPLTEDVTVVDLHRDPHGWLAEARGSGTTASNDENVRRKSQSRPRFGDVASIARAVHRGLGGDVGDDVGDDAGDDAGDEPNRVDETDRSRIVSSGRGATTTPSDAVGGLKNRGRRSGLWGRTPMKRARSVVAIDCVAELIRASGSGRTLELIDRIRADARVCGVVVYLRGGAESGDDEKTNGSFFSTATRALAAAASCRVSLTLPRWILNPLEERCDARGSDADSDASHREAVRLTRVHQSVAEKTFDPVAVIETFLSRPTGRSRAERAHVHARLSTASASSRSLDISFSALRVDSMRKPSSTSKQSGEKASGEPSEASRVAELEAEKRRFDRLQKALPFKLGVTEEESRARASVVLPFEHQGGYAPRDSERSVVGSSGSAYLSGDFLKYLPRDAGGRGGVDGGGHGGRRGRGGPGQIVYVRDSDDEGSGSAPDSDEELDEDADF